MLFHGIKEDKRMENIFTPFAPSTDDSAEEEKKKTSKQKVPSKNTEIVTKKYKECGKCSKVNHCSTEVINVCYLKQFKHNCTHIICIKSVYVFYFLGALS